MMVVILIDKLEQLKNDRYIDNNAVLLKLEYALYIIRMQWINLTKIQIN